jgi:type IV pilus assembly protein PilA
MGGTTQASPPWSRRSTAWRCQSTQEDIAMKLQRRNQKGFTLMELMVVIVIIAILAAVAVPLYINYVQDAQRTEAKGAIGAIITAEQTYLQKNNAYTNDPTQLNVDLTTDIKPRWGDPTITVNGTTGFTVKYTGVAGSATNLWVQCVYTRGSDPAWTEGKI